MRKPLDKMDPSSDVDEQRTDITDMVINTTACTYIVTISFAWII